MIDISVIYLALHVYTILFVFSTQASRKLINVPNRDQCVDR